MRQNKKNEFTSRLRHGAYHGIFDPRSFSRHASLRTYTTPSDLEPFIAHPWVIRWDVPKGQTFTAAQILWQPSINLFLNERHAFILGVVPHKMMHKTTGRSTTAGIKFKPGGFYPFYKKGVSMLTDTATPATELFPVLTDDYARTLLRQDDQEIVETLENIVRMHLPAPDPNTATVQSILNYITTCACTPSVTDVAEHFAISERSLQHLFKTYVGVGIKWTIMRTRLTTVMRHAHTDSALDWTQIATDLNYTDQPHFIHDFKNIVGLSPKQYEKLLRGDPAAYEQFTREAVYFDPLSRQNTAVRP